MVVGRFAPSPSGEMHIGNAFAALLGWLSVRSQGGRMLLRMEDLDPARSKQIYIDALKKDLEWLGLFWDEETAAQSRRTQMYEGALSELRQKGLLYPCFCSRAQLHAANAPHASDGITVYSGRCANLSQDDATSLAAQRPAALRLRVPSECVRLIDGVQGAYEEVLSRDAGDFILRRSDGVFAYQLACPFDDGAQGVSEVVRGRDLLSSAPRQMWLMQTLGYTPPTYYHVPLFLAADGRRISKREGGLSINALRRGGASPEGIIGRLAYLAGLCDAPHPLSAKRLVNTFSWEKVHKKDITLPDGFFAE